MNAAQWDVSPEVAAAGVGSGTAGMKRVIVIGAGVAGLVAAYELSRAGHQPVVLEARSRVGGRVYTVRDFAPGQYGEVGANRIPAQHHLAIAYCEHFGLPLRPFITGHSRGLVHLEGRSMRAENVALHPEDLGSVGDDHESWERLWSEAASEIRAAYAAPSPEIADLSPREFLQHRGYSETAIALCGLLSSRDQQLADPEAEKFYQITGHPTERMHEIAGGCDQLTDALFRQVARHVRLGAAVKAVVQDSDGVTVYFDSPAAEGSVRADYAVCTLPAPVLGDIEFVPQLPAAKEDATRQLRYHASTRVLLQTRRRFWEHPKYDIVGGATATDLPIRRMVYPSYSDSASARGVLLASESWDRDARMWESMDPATRIARVIEEVAQIHPEVTEDVEAGFTWSWHQDRYARGAMADFGPGQFARLQPQLAAPQDRVYFAGEHCSAYHGWIQGALDSGIRAARAVHTAPRATRAAVSRSG